MVGPYICHGIESENKALFKTQNKLPTHGADQISKYNVTAAIHELFTGQKVRLKKLDFQFSKPIIFKIFPKIEWAFFEPQKYQEKETAKIEEIIEENEEIEIDTGLHKRREKYSSVKADNFSVTFISPMDVSRMKWVFWYMTHQL